MPLVRRDSDELSSEVKAHLELPAGISLFEALAGHMLAAIYQKHFGIAPKRTIDDNPYFRVVLATCAVFNIGVDNKRLTEPGSKLPAAATILKAMPRVKKSVEKR